MKQALFYAAKVTLTTLLLCLPITFGVMMAYLNLLPLVSSNYSVNVNLDIKDAVIFVVLTFCALLFFSKKIGVANSGIYNKQQITGKAFLTAVIIFIAYILLFGKLKGYSFGAFLVTYGPSFLIMFICMKVFPLHNEEEQAKLI